MGFSRIKETLRHKAPAIFSFAGIGGFVTATYMAATATPKAMELLEEFNNDPDKMELSARDETIEKAKLLLPVYGPTISVMLISTGMILFSTQLSKYRHDAVTSIYLASQGYLKRLNDQMIEEFGSDKTDEIRAKAAGPTKGEAVPVHFVGSDKVLCYDSYSARYFEADSIEVLRQNVNDVNDILYQSSFASINDWYYEIGLPNVEYGDELGWWLEDGHIKLRFESMLSDKNRPCVVVQFDVVPRNAFNGYRGGS